jgi:hypothetical protein
MQRTVCLPLSLPGSSPFCLDDILVGILRVIGLRLCTTLCQYLVEDVLLIANCISGRRLTGNAFAGI